MSRPLALLCGAMVVALVPSTRAAEPQAQPAAKVQLPVIINLPGDAVRAQAAAQPLPIIMNLLMAPPAANHFPPGPVGPVNDVFPNGPAYAYLPFYWSPYVDYTVAYAFWAQPRPLPTAIVHPAGNLSTMPVGNVVSLVVR